MLSLRRIKQEKEEKEVTVVEEAEEEEAGEHVKQSGRRKDGVVTSGILVTLSCYLLLVCHLVK